MLIYIYECTFSYSNYLFLSMSINKKYYKINYAIPLISLDIMPLREGHFISLFKNL